MLPCALRSTKGATTGKLDGSHLRLLGEMEAWFGYRVRGKTNTPVSLIEHGRMGVLLTAFRQQIRKKRAKTAKYPSTWRPLWLLLDIEMHFGRSVDTRPLLEIIAQENPVEFDRIIVQQTRGKPLIIELPSSSNLER